jgi:hypothetical protein
MLIVSITRMLHYALVPKLLNITFVKHST